MPDSATAPPELWMSVAHAAGFIAECLLIIMVGKLLRDTVLVGRGIKLGEVLFTRDNPAAAIDLCGYLLGLVLALLGSLVVSSDTWLGQASDIAFTGLIVIVLLLAADWIADKAIFRKIDDHDAIYEQRNVALAIGRAAAAVATGLVIRGALGHVDSPLLHCAVWFVLGQLALIVISLLYQWLTPYDDLAEVRDGNVAAALPMAGILLAVGLIVEAGVNGEVTDWLADLASVGMYLGLSVVLLYVLRLITDRFLLPPGTSLASEIADDKNAGAGLIEGTTFVVGALLLSFFLT